MRTRYLLDIFAPKWGIFYFYRRNGGYPPPPYIMVFLKETEGFFNSYRLNASQE